MAQSDIPSDWKRDDGSVKGLGFLGLLQRPDGGVTSELSVGVPINGKETDIPTFVPTLNKEEVGTLLNWKSGTKIPDTIIRKATEYAQSRVASGKSPFAQNGEQQTQLFPEFKRAQSPSFMANQSNKDWASEAAKFGGTVAGASPEAHLSAAVPMTALPDTPEGRMQAVGGPPLLPKGVRDMLSTPLAHPTGIDAIDSLTSPVNLALGAVMEGPAAARLLKGAVAGLTEKMGGALAAKVLKFAIPSVLKKPAELVDILSEFGKLGEKAPAIPPADAPVIPPSTSAASANAAPATATPPPFYPQKTLNELAILARRAGATSLTGEESKAGLDLVRAGATPHAALEKVLSERAQATIGVGLPTDADVAARVAERNRTGRWPK